MANSSAPRIVQTAWTGDVDSMIEKNTKLAPATPPSRAPR